VIWFVLRGLSVSLSVFVLTYALVRLAVSCGWSLTQRRLPSLSPNWLYALQVGPFARTNAIVRDWCKNASPVQDARGLPIYKTGPDAPPLVVAGFWRPQLMVSSSTSTVLSENELARAISHESAHIDKHDNLKKLSLRVLSFPRANELEQRWLAAIEIDADRSAVNNQREALDLASALVKASRLSMATAELTTNLTSEAGALLEMRVQRLLSWNDLQSSNKLFHYLVATAGMLLATSAVVYYHILLLGMHSLAELLMQ
jgi:Zn-dependent protease with chaperone function